jgi:hypothetical protein
MRGLDRRRSGTRGHPAAAEARPPRRNRGAWVTGRAFETPRLASPRILDRARLAIGESCVRTRFSAAVSALVASTSRTVRSTSSSSNATHAA